MKRLTETQQLLADSEMTLRDFLYWPTAHHFTLGSLFIAAASLKDSNGEFKPYAIGHPTFTSQGPETGKTLSSEIMAGMTVNGKMVINCTSHGLVSMLNVNRQCPYVDEIDKLVGMRGNKNANTYTIALGHYKKGATIMRERGDQSDELVIHGPMVFTANNANAICHSDGWATFRSRAYMFVLEAAPDDHYLTEYDPEVHEYRLLNIQRRFKQWGTHNWRKIVDIPKDELGMDPRIRNRQREIWTILYRVAIFAGGVWPERCLAASRAFSLGIYGDEDTPVLSPSEEMLWAVRACFRDDEEFVSTDELLDRLCRLPQCPRMVSEWTTYKASTMGLAGALNVFGINHARQTVNGSKVWGYVQSDLLEDDDDDIEANLGAEGQPPSNGPT